VLLVGESIASSATYDEVAYLRVAARWWRMGDQTEITRMGSPLLFWKLQQAPVLWVLDHTGRRSWVDDPIGHQRELLPVVRIGASWIWVVALSLTAAWSRWSFGPKAMALAAWLFALSPNLLAHGALITMELPLIAATTAMCWFFWRFLDSKQWSWFLAAAVTGGLAFSCKFSAVLMPPILAVVWWVAQKQAGQRTTIPLSRDVAAGMLAFLLVMLLANFAITGFAHMPLSTSRGHHPTLERSLGTKGANIARRAYETPLPQDWVGFATQMHHQASGGPSYLWGERRMKGWWYYYLVALGVKVPLAFWLMAVARLLLVQRDRRLGAPPSSSNLLPVLFLAYLAVALAGSSRNYGVRYLLPLAPLAIVWVSRLAECGTFLSRVSVSAGLVGYAVAVAGIHPHELTFFNVIAGGPIGGRHVLSDSNLDWGQGLKSLYRLQKERPELRDITLYYFGDTDAAFYRVTGSCHVINAIDDHSNIPGLDTVTTPYVAISASLQFGPWGPPGFFQVLDALEPVRLTDDTTIAVYRTADLAGLLRSQRAHGPTHATRQDADSGRRVGDRLDRILH
jgi:4-amino-4-deoxy-L-arabinose transferase-like glycosyltransferase